MKEHKCNSSILTYTAIYESDIGVLSLHFDVRCVALSSIDSFNDIINNTMKIACASVTCFPNFIVVAVSMIFLTSVHQLFYNISKLALPLLHFIKHLYTCRSCNKTIIIYLHLPSVIPYISYGNL